MSNKPHPRLTVGLTYFNESNWIHQWYQAFHYYPKDIQVIIVDDGSTTDPIDEHLYPITDLGDWCPDVQVYKVTEDLGFNGHGCRNLIAKIADADFLAFFDIDMMCDPSTMGRMRQRNWQHHSLYHHDFYVWQRQRIKKYPGHLNSFVCSKQLFWEAGGYDESFTGHHWGDREFQERLKKKAKYIRNSGEVMTLRRNGKHGRVTDKVDKTVYIDDKCFLVPLPSEQVEKLKGTVNTKINFEYERIL